MAKFKGTKRARAGPGWIAPTLNAAIKAAKGLRQGYKTYRAARSAFPRSRTYTSTSTAETVRRPYARKKYVTWGKKKRRFPRARGYRCSPMQLRGVRIDVEKGGISSQAGCAYVGHSFGRFYMLQVTVEAILRQLFLQAGVRINSGDEKISGLDSLNVAPSKNFRIEYTHRTDTDDTNASLSSVTVADDETLDTLSTKIVEAWKALWTVNTKVQIIEMGIGKKHDAALNEVRPVNKINLSSMLITLDMYSSMKLQNRTLARTGTADESSMLDVANNPVVGKCYSGNGTGPRQSVFTSNVATPNASPSWCADILSGVITVNEANLRPQFMFSRPPGRGAFSNCSKAVNVRLDPGNIRPSILKFKKTFYVQTLLGILADGYEQDTTKEFLTIGKYNLFGFEKLCNTGEDEPTISLGYEVNTTYRAMVSFKKQPFITSHRLL